MMRPRYFPKQHLIRDGIIKIKVKDENVTNVTNVTNIQNISNNSNKETKTLEKIQDGVDQFFLFEELRTSSKIDETLKQQIQPLLNIEDNNDNIKDDDNLDKYAKKKEDQNCKTNVSPKIILKSCVGGGIGALMCIFNPYIGIGTGIAGLIAGFLLSQIGEKEAQSQVDNK